MIPKDNPLPLSLTSLLLTLALSLSASPTQRGDIEAVDIAQSLDALRIELGTAYNPEGELTRHTDRSGQQIDIERDGLGRLIERRYSAAAADEVAREVYELDGDGQPTRLSQYGESDGPHHIRRQYDGHGRLIAEDDRYDQHSQWTYDEVGNRLQLSYPAGTTVTQPDRINRLVRLSRPDGSTELRYSPAGRLQQLHHPNGARSDYHYDNAGRIERLTHWKSPSTWQCRCATAWNRCWRSSVLQS